MRYIPNFIREDEEKELIANVEKMNPDDWAVTSSHSFAGWFASDFGKDVTRNPKFPNWMRMVLERMMSLKNAYPEDYVPDHMMIHKYKKGQGIPVGV